MDFREFFKSPPKKKQDKRKFMSKIFSSKDLDGLADEMKEKGYKFKKKRESNNLHKWLLERMEKVRQCLKLLSEAEQCSLNPPRKWKNGDKE